MNLHICLLLIAVAKCTASVSPSQCMTSSVGNNFVFGVIGFYTTSTGPAINLHITPVDQVQARVRITAPYINMDKTLNVTNYTISSLDGKLAQFENGTQFKGIEVSSDVKISVHVVTTASNEEGFLALPVNALGTSYIASSYKPYSSYSSEIVVVGVESDTDVFLSTKIGSHSGSNQSFRLQKFESFQFKAKNDVSGSIITSNKPISVIAGSAYAQVPVGIGSYQYLIEQMVPTKYWTTRFIVPPIYPRKYFILRFFADHNNTEIQYYNSTKHFAVYMSKGSMEEVVFGTDPVVVIATKPINVIQYGHDGDNKAGDPFMSTAQGISEYEESYKFVSQNTYSSGDTVAITIRKSNTEGLLLNGLSLTHYHVYSVPPPMDQYMIMFIDISHGTYYHLYHGGGLKFGAVIYGRYSTSVAYGYPLQLSLIANDCNVQSHRTSNVVTVVPPTSPSYSTVFNTIEYKGNGHWCFQCEGMGHLMYCDKVARCKDENEVCYIQSYTRSLGVHLFRSGCTHPKNCSDSGGNGDCTNCCNGSFCNTAGCGDDGFPVQRGPICFDCTHLGGSEECKTVQLCQLNQVCMIEKYKWGDNDFHFIRACADSQECSEKRSTNELSTRHAPVCSHCCHSDFCNNNCTSTNIVQEIIG